MRITCLEDARARLKLGRIIALTGAAAYCLLRAFILIFQPSGELSPSAALITADGRLIWPWAAAWFAAAGWCIWDIIRGRTRHGLSYTVALAMAWGTGNVWIWILEGFAGTAWISAIGFYAPALIVFGMLLKIGALYDLLEDITTHLGEGKNR